MEESVSKENITGMEDQNKAVCENENITEAIYAAFGHGKWKTSGLSALALAYIGDCVFDLVIRTVLTTHEGGTNKNLHKKSISMVNAATQARMIESLEDILTEEENAVFHRGRNAKSGSSAKNASITDYRKATGLEALVGYLYLEGRYNRIVELIKNGLERTGVMDVWKQEN